jgi:D-glycero-alpha-D-manno-heptose 1-phosphate guanylyltransferase
MLDAIILAGGLGSRLANRVPEIPKALAPIQGIPFLQLCLSQLSASPFISKIVMALGHRADAIRSYLQKQIDFPIPIEYSIESSPLGTGGSILFALPRTEQETLLVVNGDTFCDLSIEDFYAFHDSKHANLSIAAVQVDDCSRYGSIQIGAEQRIYGFEEKSNRSRKGWINAGAYLIQKKSLTGAQEGPSSLEKDLIPLFIGNGLYAFLHTGVFIDIGTPRSYEQAQTILQPWIHL